MIKDIQNIENKILQAIKMVHDKTYKISNEYLMCVFNDDIKIVFAPIKNIFFFALYDISSHVNEPVYSYNNTNIDIENENYIDFYNINGYISISIKLPPEPTIDSFFNESLMYDYQNITFDFITKHNELLNHLELLYKELSS